MSWSGGRRPEHVEGTTGNTNKDKDHQTLMFPSVWILQIPLNLPVRPTGPGLTKRQTRSGVPETQNAESDFDGKRYSVYDPGWRNWQRARLLTGRSRVRAPLWELFSLTIQEIRFSHHARLGLSSLLLVFSSGTGCARTHGAMATRRIPDPKIGGSIPSGFTFFNTRLTHSFAVGDRQIHPTESDWSSTRIHAKRTTNPRCERGGVLSGGPDL